MSKEAGELGLTCGNLFHRTPFRVGRGRRAAVVWVMHFECAGIYLFFCFLSCERTRPTAVSGSLALFTSLLFNSSGGRTCFHYLITVVWLSGSVCYVGSLHH